MLDVSENEESVRIKLNSCRETLAELSVDPTKILLVLNKIDLLKDGSARQIESSPLFNEFSVVKISAVRGDGMTQLKNRIMQKTYPNAGLQTRPQAEKERAKTVRPVTDWPAEPARPGLETSA